MGRVMSCLREQINAAKKSMAKRARYCPELFLEYNQLQSALEQLRIANQEVEKAKKNWNRIRYPEIFND
jgi:HrpA-like RNA helicase